MHVRLPNEGDERPNLTSTGPWASCGYRAMNWGTRGPFGGVQGPLSQCTFASTMSHHRATSSGSKGRVTQPRADARRAPRVVSRFLLGRLSGAAAFSTSREANRAGQKEVPPPRGVGSDQVKWQHMHSSAAGVAQPLRSSPPTIPGATRRELAPQWAPSEVIHARQRRRSKQSPQQILHLTHLSMASRCGSRAPQLDTALMDSPLVLTREWRPPGQQK